MTEILIQSQEKTNVPFEDETKPSKNEFKSKIFRD